LKRLFSWDLKSRQKTKREVLSGKRFNESRFSDKRSGGARGDDIGKYVAEIRTQVCSLHQKNSIKPATGKITRTEPNIHMTFRKTGSSKKTLIKVRNRVS
jgi:hypothetical protein